MLWSIYLGPKFSTQMHQLFIIKICFTIKVNSICGAGRDTRNLCHKSNSQGPALRIMGLSVASPKSQGPSSGCQGLSSRVPCLRVSGPGSQGIESQGPGSQMVILDYAQRNNCRLRENTRQHIKISTLISVFESYNKVGFPQKPKHTFPQVFDRTLKGLVTVFEITFFPICLHFSYYYKSQSK